MGRPRRTALIRSCTSAAAASLERSLGQDLAGPVQGDGLSELLLVAVEAVPWSLVGEGGHEPAPLHLDGAEALDGRGVPGLAGVAALVAPADWLVEPAGDVDHGVAGAGHLLPAAVLICPSPP